MTDATTNQSAVTSVPSRAERRSSQMRQWPAVAVLVLSLFLFGWLNHQDDIARCETREDYRQAIIAAVDEVAIYVELSDAEKAEVTRQVQNRTLAELPSC